MTGITTAGPVLGFVLVLPVLRHAHLWLALTSVLVGACTLDSDDPEDAERTTDVYAAIFRWLAASDTTDPEPLPIFVAAGDDGAPIGLEVQAATITEVVEVATVKYVDTPEEARDPAPEDSDEDPPVRDGGVLVTVGAIEPTSQGLTVDLDLIRGAGVAQPMRFELDAEGEAWAVVGQPQEIAPD